MYAFCQDMPGFTVESQAELAALLPSGALDKCIAHVVGPIDGGTRMVDVWESEDDYRAFMQEHLYPTIARMQQDQPLQDTRGMAPFSVLDVTGSGYTAAHGLEGAA